jgi:hypothetical protein
MVQSITQRSKARATTLLGILTRFAGEEDLAEMIAVGKNPVVLYMM